MRRVAVLGLLSLAHCTPSGSDDAGEGSSGSGVPPTSLGSDGPSSTGVETTSPSPTTETTSTTGTTGPGTLDTGSSGEESSTTDSPPAYDVELSLITDQNRAYVRMYGGWGPHLRGVMRDASGTLWFTADAGPDVLTNTSILYFREGDAGWEQVASQPHLPGVQQNSASVLSGSLVLTYSVNIATQTLEECYLDTADLGYFACNTITIGGPYTTPAQSNYVGAALSPNGARVVWFTTVGGAGSGQFTYTYNFGGGWNGPVAWTLPGYNTFEYVRAAFETPNTITWHGQLLLGRYPGGTFDPAISEAMLGSVPSLDVLGTDDRGTDVLTGADLWIDPSTGDVHAIAQAAPQLAYYVRPAGESWAEHTQPVYWFPDTFRARFIAPASGELALVRGSASGESGVDVWIVSRPTGGAIDWDAATVVDVPTMVPGLERPSGIYVEGDTYQSAPIGGLNFALCGAYGESDQQVWHGVVTAR